MSKEVVVVGAGLHRYGAFPEVSVPIMGTVALRHALQDANMQWDDVQEAYCGSMGKAVYFPGHQLCGAMGRECSKREIEKEVNLAMAHLVGAGGVCAIHLLKK